MEKIKELNYRPNKHARSYAKYMTNTAHYRKGEWKKHVYQGIFHAKRCRVVYEDL
jgi:DNA-binding LacI/PurR family transcriptional regulator